MSLFGGGSSGPSYGEIQAMQQRAAKEERDRIAVEEQQAKEAAQKEADRLRAKRRGNAGNVFSRGPTLGGVGTTVKRTSRIGYESRDQYIKNIREGGNPAALFGLGTPEYKNLSDPNWKGRKVLLGE